MRRVITLALAGAAALSLATAANATVTLTTATSNLPTHITAQGNVPGDPLSTINDQLSVYGTDGSQSSDVKFTGNTNIHITDGNGFALIEDADKDNPPLFQQLVIDPTFNNFTKFQFSVSTLSDTWLLIQFATTGDAVGTWHDVLMGADDPPLKGVSNPFWAPNGNADYNITANNGEILSRIRVSTCGGTAQTKQDPGAADCTTLGTAGLQYVKQNSIVVAEDVVINPLGGVPEPSTWAMMLLGFGGIGVAMRRGRKQTAALRQVA